MADIRSKPWEQQFHDFGARMHNDLVEQLNSQRHRLRNYNYNLQKLVLPLKKY